MADGGLNICGFGSVLGRGAGFGQNLPEGAALLDVGGGMDARIPITQTEITPK